MSPATTNTTPNGTAPAVEATVAPPTPAVAARGLALHGPRGRVYGPVDLDVAPGTLVVLQGAQGSGRTSLLLTLPGRAPSARRG